MKKLFVSLLLLLLVVAGVQAQTVSLTVPGGVLYPGQTVTATACITNVLQPRLPITTYVIVSYIDCNGVSQQATSNNVTLQVVQPLNMPKLTLNLGTQLTLVEGSATSIIPIAATISNSILEMSFNKTLLEGQSLEITFDLNVAR